MPTPSVIADRDAELVAVRDTQSAATAAMSADLSEAQQDAVVASMRSSAKPRC